MKFLKKIIKRTKSLNALTTKKIFQQQQQRNTNKEASGGRGNKQVPVRRRSFKDTSATSNNTTTTTTTTTQYYAGETAEFFSTATTTLASDAEESSAFMTNEELQATSASIARATKGAAGSDFPQPDEATMKKRVAVVEKFWRLVNAQNLQSAKSLTTDDVQFHYYIKDRSSKNLNMEMPWEEWAMEQERCYASFPDLTYTYEKIITPAAGVVIVKGFKCSGTHSGAPYAFGPCEPIDAAFQYVQNDPEELCFFFASGGDREEEEEPKFCRMNACAKGEMCGPAGLYTQLGGFPLL